MNETQKNGILQANGEQMVHIKTSCHQNHSPERYACTHTITRIQTRISQTVSDANDDDEMKGKYFAVCGL
jgi:hypothetical protein